VYEGTLAITETRLNVSIHVAKEHAVVTMTDATLLVIDRTFSCRPAAVPSTSTSTTFSCRFIVLLIILIILINIVILRHP